MAFQEIGSRSANGRDFRNTFFRKTYESASGVCRIARLMHLHAGAAAALAEGAGGAGDTVIPAAVSRDSPTTTTRVSHPVSESSSSSGENILVELDTSNGNPPSPRQGAPKGRLVTDRNARGRLVTDSSTRSRLVTDSGSRIPTESSGNEPKSQNEAQEEQTFISRGWSRNTNEGQGQRKALPRSDLETDGDGPSTTPAGAKVRVGAGQSMLPGVSRVMFDNTVKENLRLKKMLEEALQKDGSGVKVFLVSLCYIF